MYTPLSATQLAQYVADVGFGGIALPAPLVLNSSEPRQALHERFCINTAGNAHIPMRLLI
jgi:arylamine N-acetyltransferase